jgi:hypothetical protein
MSPQFEFELLLFGIITAFSFTMLGFAAGVALMAYIVTAPYLAPSQQNDGA